MPVSSALRRLMRVRGVEEEQRRLALESALGELRTLEHARAAAIVRERAGRQLLVESAAGSEITDRTAAIVEVKFSARVAAALTPIIAAAEFNVANARQAYLDKRMERRQAQTLIEEAEARDTLESGRRTQQTLDAAYGARRHREMRDERKHPDRSKNTADPAKVNSDLDRQPSKIL